MRVSHKPLVKWKKIEIALLMILAVSISGFLFVDRTAALVKPVFKSTFYGWDDTFYYLWLQTPVIENSLDFEQGFRKAPSLTEEFRSRTLQNFAARDQTLINKYPIGWAVLHAPGYLVAHVSSKLLSLFGVAVDATGFGRIYQGAVALNGYLYSLLGLFFLFKWLRRYLSFDDSLIASAYVILSSSVYYYLFRQVSMSHHLVFSLVAAAYYFTDELDQKPKDTRLALVLGILSGLLILVRPQACLYLVYPAWSFLQRWRRPGFWKSLSLGSLMGLVLVSAAGLANHLQFGSAFVYTYSGEGFNWFAPEILKVLFSPQNGAIYWHPILLLCGGAATWMAVKGQHELPHGPRFLVISILLVWLNAAWWCWWYGASFGNRAFEGIYVPCALILGVFLRSLERDRAWRTLVGLRCLLLLLCVWNLHLVFATRYAKRTGIGMEEGYSFLELIKGVGRLYGFN